MKTQTMIYLAKEDIEALEKVSSILHTLDSAVLKRTSSGLFTWEDLSNLALIAMDEDIRKTARCLAWGNQGNNAEAYAKSIKREDER